MRKMLIGFFLGSLAVAGVGAQTRPEVRSTIQTTSTAASSLLVGCAFNVTTGCTGGINSGPIVVNTGGINIVSNVPSDSTMKLYNNAGTLTWNGAPLAVGSSVSGTTGTISVFTASNALGDSIITQTGGNTITVTGTFNATSAIQLNGTSINTAGTLANVAYLNAANTFSSASGQTFAGGISLSGGVVSTHGIMIPNAVPGSTTTNLYNNAGVLTWAGAGLPTLTAANTFTGANTFGALTVTTLNTYTFNQSVASGASPTFTGTNFTGIVDGALSANVAFLTGTQTFTGRKTFSNAAGIATNGLVVTSTDQLWIDGSGGTGGDTYFQEAPANTMRLVAGNVITTNASGVWTFPVSGSTFTTDLKVLGAEAGDATLYLWADEGDDVGDKWSLVSTQASNGLTFATAGVTTNTATVRVTASDASSAIFAFTAAEARASVFRLVADDGDDAEDEWSLAANTNGSFTMSTTASGTLLTIASNGTLTLPYLASSSGTRYVCSTTTGALTDSASACSGTDADAIASIPALLARIESLEAQLLSRKQ